MASVTSPRSSGADFWHRARIKTVVSRRFTSSFSSHNDEEVGYDNEEDEYLSCFEDVPDSECEDRESEEESNAIVTVREDVELRYDTDRGRRANNRLIRGTNQQGQSSANNIGKRSAGDQSDKQQNGIVKNRDSSKLSGGDHYRIGGDSDKGFYKKISESDHQKNIDFVDMAISRDNPDMGLSRVDSNYHSRKKQKLQQEKIPKLRKFQFQPTVKFGCFDILIGVVAIVIFFIDIGTDMELAFHYFREEMWMYGGVTLGLIVAPSMITCFLGFHWYMIDYKKEKELVAKLRKAKKKAYVTPSYVWILRFTFTLLQVGPVVRIIEYLRCGQKSISKKLSERQQKRFYIFMLYEDVDSCLLRLFESFLESAPQLTWQIYIAIVLKPADDVVGTSVRYAALLSSWGSLAISLVSYHKSLRNSHEEKAKMTVKSLPFYFIWRASEVGGRVICIAMFASAFQLWVFGPILFHWVAMSFWLIIQRTTFYKNKCLEKAFNVICGYVMIFCFLNLREGVTRYRFLFFYFITYVENFFMLGLWFRFSPDLGAWFHIWGFVVVLILFVLHMIFQLTYYALFHPTGNIEMCLSCDPYVMYGSTCHDITPSKKDAHVQTDGHSRSERSVDMELIVYDSAHIENNHPESKYRQTDGTNV